MYQFSFNELCLIREVISADAVTLRSLIRNYIDSGDAAFAGFYARALVKNERAAHVAYQLQEHFPSE